MSSVEEVNATVRLAYDLGLCIVPPREDGSKRPLGTWEQYQHRRPSLDELRETYTTPRHGLGVVCGAVSGELEVLDFDNRQKYHEFKAAAALAGLDELVERIEAGYLEFTPNGVHWIWRTDKAGGNTKLAMRQTGPHTFETLIETRGAGGYCILAPSFGPVNPDGEYICMAGSLAGIPRISQTDRDALLEVARKLDECERVETVRVFSTNGQGPTSGRAGDDFNARGDWHEDVLLPAKWTPVVRMGAQEFWRRPGKDHGHSAVLHHDTGFFVPFSTSTPFPVTEVGYGKFRAYAILHHEGDFSAAARALRELGYGEEREKKTPPPDPEGNLWFPGVIDLDRLANERQPQMFLSRADGVPLLYEGETNYLFGAPGALKSWLALAAVKEHINQERYVAYYDFDRNRESKLVGRLRGIGVPDEAIVKFLRYACPSGPAGIKGGNVEVLAGTLSSYDLVVFDSVNNGARLDNLTMSNEDVALWFRLPEAFTDKGTTALLLDHVTKNVETRRWPVGAQHKMAATGGAAIRVELVQNPIQKPGSERDGISRLYVEKDRHGFLPVGYGECLSILRLRISPGEDRRELIVGIPTDQPLEVELNRVCVDCGEGFQAASRKARFCSDTCRQRASRRNRTVSPDVDGA